MKRRIATLLIFLLLGSIANVAVAWGIAVVRRPLEQPRPGTDWADYWTTLSGSTTVGVRSGIVDACVRSDLWSVSPSSLTRRSFAEFREHLRKDSPFRNLEGVYTIGSARAEHPIIGYECGFPCRTASFEFFVGPAVTTGAGNLKPQWRYAGALTLTNRAPKSPDVLLPIRPIWPGFAINSLFYAPIVWLVFAVLLVLRRMRRLKRGLCPACAYPVGTSDLCTECGKPVSRSHATLR